MNHVSKSTGLQRSLYYKKSAGSRAPSRDAGFMLSLVRAIWARSMHVYRVTCVMRRPCGTVHFVLGLDKQCKSEYWVYPESFQLFPYFFIHGRIPYRIRVLKNMLLFQLNKVLFLSNFTRMQRIECPLRRYVFWWGKFVQSCGGGLSNFIIALL